MKALANEIAKNLALAGIGSLTIIDHEAVTEPDLGAQFFISQEHVGQNVGTLETWSEDIANKFCVSERKQLDPKYTI